MRITYYGHACFGLETMGKHILFDPFISPNELAASVSIDEIQADYILVSHGHEDHVADVERIASRTGATVISNYEVATWFSGKGLRTMPLNHGGSWRLDVGQIKYVNAVHSSVLPDGTYGGNPGGFVIRNEEGCLYYAGDTALHMDMQLLKTQFDIDTAVLPMGDVFTMGYEDAVTASEFAGCNRVIGMHYDTFPPIKLDRDAATRAFAEAGKALTLMDIGSSMEL